jgi:hypothetical protein
MVIHRWGETLELSSVGKVFIMLDRSILHIALVRGRNNEQLRECFGEEAEFVLIHPRGR